jgi:peptidoglycan-N-acetylglucosamine deacetylase
MKAAMTFLLGLLLAAPALAEPAQSRWPGGARAAIALTYDDAAPSQLDVAVPQLDAAGLKGTFFLMAKAMNPGVVERWRAVATSGHELGNHTVNHPCARGTYEMPPQYYSENYSVETMLTDIGVMNTLLTALDGKQAHAFATPCGQNLVGGADYIAPLQASGLASYIRDERATPPPPGAPPITGTGFADVDGATMIAWVEGVRRNRGAGVIVFHGVGGDHLSVSGEAHQALVSYLAAHPRDYWVTTFSELIAREMAPAPR